MSLAQAQWTQAQSPQPFEPPGPTEPVRQESASAELKPLWEAGLGVGALGFPDYRGSDETNLYPIPVPYFIYRGDFLKADEDGMRGELFEHDRIDLSVSLNGTTPVNSERNHAREGMPNLRATIEIGPSVDVHLWQSGDERIRLDAIMPLRLPITIESSPRSIGWMFAPRINLDASDAFGVAGWDFGVGAGPLYADRKFHRYFYSVSEQFATQDRPAYEASGGYSGFHALAAMSKRYPDYWVGAYVRYDALGSAVFEDSPLVTSKHSLSGGIGIAWMLGQSSRRVEEK